MPKREKYDDPRCEHPELSHRVVNESQAAMYRQDRPMRMARVCGRPECILDALAWVSRGTGERALWAPPGGEYRDTMPTPATPEGNKE